MSAQIEARRLSGEHLGRTVTAATIKLGTASGTVVRVEHVNGEVLAVLDDGQEDAWFLYMDPSDLVTIEGARS